MAKIKMAGGGRGIGAGRRMSVIKIEQMAAVKY